MPVNKRSSGFTVIELIVVLAVVGILLAIVAPRYLQHVKRAEETALRHNLFQMRDAIDKFRSDQGRYPQELAELVSGRYLRQLPVDPVSKSATTWVLVAPTGGSEQSGVYDVRSGASGKGLNGEDYASW